MAQLRRPPSQPLLTASLTLVLLGALVSTGFGQTFVDVTASAGIQHSQLVDTANRFGDRMSGGAVAGDFNGDGWVDLFFTRGDASDLLYLNNGAGGFTEASAVAGFTATHRTNGAAAGDIDNDGDLDLYVTTFREEAFLLYINDGTGTFEEQAVARGAHVPMDNEFSRIRRGNSVSLGDYDRDGYLDLHTTDWGNRLDQADRVLPEYSASRLLRNVGAASPGSFEDVTTAAGVGLQTTTVTGGGNTISGVYSFASRFADIDGDGWDDLLVAGDFNSSRLFWNNGDGTFTDGTAAAGVGTDENGMGSAVGDYDGDGDLDWFVTSIDDPDDPCPVSGRCGWAASGNRLYRYDGNRQFSDQTDAAGVRDGDWGWGAVWFDYDLDGDLDLSMTNGIDFGVLNDPTDGEAKFNEEPMRLWRNDGGGTMTEVALAEGLTDVRAGKGLLTLDYDNDGDLDLLNVNNSASPALYRNDTISPSSADGAAWLKIDTIGVLSNRDGIGAKVTIDPDTSVVGDEIFRDVNGGSHYLTQSDITLHFGVGDLQGLIDEVRIVWPSGLRQTLIDVAPNQLLTVTEVPEPAAAWLAIAAAFVARRRTRTPAGLRGGELL